MRALIVLRRTGSSPAPRSAAASRRRPKRRRRRQQGESHGSRRHPHHFQHRLHRDRVGFGEQGVDLQINLETKEFNDFSRLWLGEIRFPFGGLGFGSIRGALFADFGGAWDSKYVETLGSVGGGIRLNFGGFLVLRYDIGKRIEENLAKFQEGLFYQFFFGWDF